MKTSTTTNTTAAAPETTSAAVRHPRPATSDASSGRKTSCPVAFAADNMPSTRPRRSSNHRFATMAASTIEVTPGARANQHAPQQRQLPLVPHARGERDGDGQQRHRGEDDAPQSPSIHDRGGKRTKEAEERDVDRDGG